MCSPITLPNRCIHFVLNYQGSYPLLHLTCGAGAMDDKDLAVSSHHGNVWLLTPPWESQEESVEHSVNYPAVDIS